MMGLRWSAFYPRAGPDVRGGHPSAQSSLFHPFNDLRLPLLWGSPGPAGGKFPFRATNFDVGVEKAKVVLDWGPGLFLYLTVPQPRDGPPPGGGVQKPACPPPQRSDTHPPFPHRPLYLWAGSVVSLETTKAPKRRVYRTPHPVALTHKGGQRAKAGDRPTRPSRSSAMFSSPILDPEVWKICSKIRTRLVSSAMNRSVDRLTI